jgi:hypothetical protein
MWRLSSEWGSSGQRRYIWACHIFALKRSLMLAASSNPVDQDVSYFDETSAHIFSVFTNL